MSKVTRVYRICNAYESGVGKGWQGEPDNPRMEGTEEYEAWDIGFEAGQEQRRKAEATTARLLWRETQE